jgi:PPOX class probable F420-dependent enzyme
MAGTAIERIAAAQYALMDRLRDPRALDLALRAPTAEDFAAFAGARQCLLVSYRRSGQPVPSAVNFGLGGGRLYLRTDGSSAKVKRLRNDPRVLVTPCGLRGTPRGPAVHGTARILPGPEQEHADAVVAANWSSGMRLLERGLDKAASRFALPLVYVEITASPPPG